MFSRSSCFACGFHSSSFCFFSPLQPHLFSQNVALFSVVSFFSRFISFIFPFPILLFSHFFGGSQTTGVCSSVPPNNNKKRPSEASRCGRRQKVREEGSRPRRCQLKILVEEVKEKHPVNMPHSCSPQVCEHI